MHNIFKAMLFCLLLNLLGFGVAVNLMSLSTVHIQAQKLNLDLYAADDFFALLKSTKRRNKLPAKATRN